MKRIVTLTLLAASLACPIYLDARDIHTWARQGNLDSLKAGLEKEPESIDDTDPRGFTPLHWAAFSGQTETVSWLLAQNADIDSQNPQGFTPFSLACYAGQFEAAEKLLDAGADINAPGMNGWTPVFLSALRANPDAARFYIKHGADLNCRDQDGATPFHMALINSQPRAEEVAGLFLEAGAEFKTVNNEGVSPLMTAVTRGYSRIVKTLLEKGADATLRERDTQRTLLHLAAIHGYLDVLQPLLELNLDLNDRDALGQTPLYYAKKHGHADLVSAFIQAGAHPQNADTPGQYQLLSSGTHGNAAAIWRLNSRGWALKTQNRLLIIDNEYNGRAPDQPSLCNGFIHAPEIDDHHVIAAYTCYHAEPNTKEFIHGMEDQLKQITYVHYENDAWRGNENTLYLKGQGRKEIDSSQWIYYENQSADGMGWLNYGVESDGVTLYYGGFFPDDIEAYKKEIDYLKSLEKHWDLAFIQFDKNREDCFRYALEHLKPRAVFPKRAQWNPTRTEKALLEKIMKDYPDIKMVLFDNSGDRFVYKNGVIELN